MKPSVGTTTTSRTDDSPPKMGPLRVVSTTLGVAFFPCVPVAQAASYVGHSFKRVCAIVSALFVTAIIAFAIALASASDTKYGVGDFLRGLLYPWLFFAAGPVLSAYYDGVITALWIMGERSTAKHPDYVIDPEVVVLLLVHFVCHMLVLAIIVRIYAKLRHPAGTSAMRSCWSCCHTWLFPSCSLAWAMEKHTDGPSRGADELPPYPV